MATCKEIVAGDKSWAEMLPEALVGIFQRLPLEDMFRTVPLVCSSWRKASLEPCLWECIDLRDWVEDFASSPEDVDRMLRLIVDRSCGRLQELSLTGFGTDDMLAYIAERCNSVKCLRFPHSDITDPGICKVAYKLPHLEEISISGCDGLSKLAIEALGQKCKALRWLERSGSDSCYTLVGPLQNDEEALAIANNMPQLKHLEMVDTQISNAGLLALLEGCHNLEYLDLRRCRNLMVEAPTLQKCARIKEFYVSDEFEEEYWEFEEVDGLDYFDDLEEWFNPYDDYFHLGMLGMIMGD